MNFWDVHTAFFIFFLLLCPRFTMLVTGVCFYSFAYPILFFFGWLICPRVVIAILATINYWDTNPVLCVFAWLLAGSFYIENKQDVNTLNKIRRRY